MPKRRPAVAGDYWTELVPLSTSRSVRLGVDFTRKEMRLIRLGLIPRAQEDRWFIYYEDSVLNMHRSWTGFCLYQVRFDRTGDAWTASGAAVNCDPDQYRAGSDDHERGLIEGLIRVLLLGQDYDFALHADNPEGGALEMWGMIGRAMFQGADETDEDGDEVDA